MKNQQDFFQGLMTIRIKGKLLEAFVQACTKRGCKIYDMKRISHEEIVLTILWKDFKIWKQLRRKYKCKVFLEKGQGVPFLLQGLFRKNALLIAFCLAIVLVFLLANTLWSVEIKGINPELEAAVEEKLDSYGVSPGKLLLTMHEPGAIQKKLLDDLPDLLWIGVKKQGTSYHLYGVEKTRHDKDDQNQPADLVASKKGMIIKPFIKKGRPLVSVYDVVKKGQRLATGQLVDEEKAFVHAEGEVIAETWYKVEQTLPVKQVFQLTEGTHHKKYEVSIGSFAFPIWGWWKEGNFREEQKVYSLEVLRWKPPVHVKRIDLYEIDDASVRFSEKQLMEKGVQFAMESLKQQLKKDSIIKDEKVLHHGVENGKVKLILLFKVHEDIAMTKYISQGD
ncbi:sporulation protein YqfD [Halobacillus fulvus]|nr:sporulation protein YqfD [Halobacillus fulvus]